MSDFLDLHRPGDPLILPNPWDVGSAKILQQLGFKALATTSGGFAATLGRPDGGVSREEAIEHAAAIAASVEVPVTADLENGFGDSPEEVAETVRQARSAGLAGCSVEDFTRDADRPVYDLALATDRVAAAVEAAGDDFVLTARADGLLHGRPDLADAIERLQAFASVGAHVVYAPGLARAEDVATVVGSVDRPVNVLARPGLPAVAELASLGAARISVGGAFAYAAYGELVAAARELADTGTYGHWAAAGTAREVVSRAFAR